MSLNIRQGTPEDLDALEVLYYVDTVSLGREKFGLDWFRLYEKML